MGRAVFWALIRLILAIENSSETFIVVFKNKFIGIIPVDFIISPNGFSCSCRCQLASKFICNISYKLPK